MVLSKMLGLADLLWLSNLSSILNLFQSLTTTTIFGILLIYNYLRLQLHGYNKTIKKIYFPLLQTCHLTTVTGGTEAATLFMTWLR